MPLFSSLRAKTTTLVSLLLAGVLILCAFLVLVFIQRELQRLISVEQFLLVTEMSKRIDDQLELGLEFIARAAEDLPPELLADSDRAQAYLDRHLGLLAESFFDNGIFLFDDQGLMVAEVPFRPGRRGRDYSFRDYFKNTVAAVRPLISDPYRSSQEHGHPAVNFTAPVLNAGGEVAGVLAGSVDLTRSNFLGGLVDLRIGRTGYFYLFNENRRIIMHPDSDRIMRQDVPPGANRLFDRALEGFEGTEETVNSRGLHALTSFKHLRATDWILGANYPQEEAYAPVRRARDLFLAGFVLILLVGVAAAGLFARHLTRPLQQLTDHIRSQCYETEPAPVLVRTRDEMALLAEAFNQMAREVYHQRMQARGQLRFLQTVIDTIPHPLYYRDTRGRYLGCNLAFEEVAGRPREEILGRGNGELSGMALPPEDSETDQELLDASSGRFQIFEAPLRYSDGSRREGIFYKAVFTDPEGEPGGVVGIVVDITARKEAETALAEEKLFSESLLQNSAFPSFVVDQHHRVLIWNHACEELTGLAAAEILGTGDHWRAFYDKRRPCLADIVIDQALEEVPDLYQSFADSPMVRGGLQAEGWFPDVGGRRRYLIFEAAPIRDSSGEIIAAIETFQEMTARKQAEEALAASERNFRSLMQRSPEALVVHREGRLLFGNARAAEIWGAENPEDLVGLEVDKLVHPESLDLVRSRLERVMAEKVPQGHAEIKLLRLDGETIDVEVASSPVSYGAGLAIQTVFRDISERKAREEAVWHQANFDGLTGLPNRNLFLDRLKLALRQADRLGTGAALVYIDLDGLKEVNDRLGHEAGDELLRQAGRRLLDAVRETDTPARLGGDEFTVVLPGMVRREEAGVVAERILKVLREPLLLQGERISPRASLGIAFYPRDAGDSENLLRQADAAMYRAKQAGGDSCLILPG